MLWPVVANGQIPNGFPTSQSLNFAPSKLPWNSEAISNPFVVSTFFYYIYVGHEKVSVHLMITAQKTHSSLNHLL